jgi:hypothetical protein
LDVLAFSAFAHLIPQTTAVEYGLALIAYFSFFLRHALIALPAPVNHFPTTLALPTDEVAPPLLAYALIVIVILTNAALQYGFNLVPLVTYLANSQLFLQFAIIKAYLGLVSLD